MMNLDPLIPAKRESSFACLGSGSPLSAFADLATRARRLVSVYQDNDRLAEENERLMGWQQAALKRDMQVKDTGRLLAGHGGVLDRIDAFLFALPAAFFTILALT